MADCILCILLAIVTFYFSLASANFGDVHSIIYNLDFLLVFTTGITFLTPFKASAVAILIVVVIVAARFEYPVFFCFADIDILIFLISLLSRSFSAFFLILELALFCFSDSSISAFNYKNAILFYIFSILYYIGLLLMASEIPLKFF